MPIYAYRCAKCGEETEVMRSMSDPPLRRCPSCKAMKLRQVFQPVGIAFRGPGFYRTDYARSKPSDEKQPEDKKPDEKKPDEKKPPERKASEKKAETKKTE